MSREGVSGGVKKKKSRGVEELGDNSGGQLLRLRTSFDNKNLCQTVTRNGIIRDY